MSTQLWSATSRPHNKLSFLSQNSFPTLFFRSGVHLGLKIYHTTLLPTLGLCSCRNWRVWDFCLGGLELLFTVWDPCHIQIPWGAWVIAKLVHLQSWLFIFSSSAQRRRHWILDGNLTGCLPSTFSFSHGALLSTLFTRTNFESWGFHGRLYNHWHRDALTL